MNNPIYTFEKQYVDVPADACVLITGSRLYKGREDRRKLFDNAIGVDAIDGPGVDVCLNLEGDVSNLGTFDHIECCSVLEHSRRPWLLARNLIQLLRPAGTIYLAVPFVWRYHGYPNDYWRFTAQGIEELFSPEIHWVGLAYASDELGLEPNRRYVMQDDYPYLARCQVLGFGFKKS